MGKENVDLCGVGNGFISILDAYDKMIGSYDLVIEDLSGEIYDPVMQAQKGPVIVFLKTMREQWRICREDAKRQIDAMRL